MQRMRMPHTGEKMMHLYHAELPAFIPRPIQWIPVPIQFPPSPPLHACAAARTARSEAAAWAPPGWWHQHNNCWTEVEH